MVKEGSSAEAIRDLEPLQNKEEYALAATACLIDAHKANKSKDSETLDHLKEALKNHSRTSNDQALTLAGRFFWHAGKDKQARQCVEKVLSKQKKDATSVALYGWLNMGANSRSEKKASQYFDTALKTAERKKPILALLGRAAVLERKQRYDKVLDDLNQIIVQYPAFVPALCEKARILMLAGNWDEAVATAHRVLKRDSVNIDALRVLIVYLLAREPRVKEVSQRISDLIAAIEQNEPRNARLFHVNAQLIARLAGRKKPILQQSIKLCQRAVSAEPQNAVFIAELAHQLTLLEQYDAALQQFDEASRLESKTEEGNLAVLHGGVRCKVLKGDYKEAEAELEFLNEMQTSGMGASAELSFLSAMIAWHVEHDDAKSIRLLNQCIDEHIKALEKANPGFDYYIAYNPDFVLEVVQEYMLHMGVETVSASDPPSAVIKKVEGLLSQLVEITPSNLSGQLLLGKASYIAGDFDAAEKAVQACIRLDPGCAEAYVLQAKVFISRDNFKLANQALEQARSANFEVRNSITFNLLKARIQDASGQTEEGIKLLQSAMSLPGVRKTANNKSSAPLQERISLYLELASMLSKHGMIAEASKLMSDARSEFQKTAEFDRITMADADLALKRKDADGAISLLRQVPPESSFYMRAKLRMADIFLKYKKNKKTFAACYQELAYQSKSVHSYILLGEAYMRIQEPDRALKAFEDALRLNPDDPALASRIGRALVTTHDYARAVEYYESAAKADPSKVYLLHELADLYLQLHKYEEATRVLTQALQPEQKKDPEDFKTLTNDVKSYLLLAKVFEGLGADMVDKVKESLHAAWETQTAVLSLRLNQDVKQIQMEIAADVCHKLAEFHDLQLKDYEKAQQFYNEALKHNETHDKARLALARLHMMNSDLEGCKHQCLTLIKIDPQNKEAVMMLADVMFRQDESDNATAGFQQLLEKNPTNWAALQKLISLLRKAGKLSEVPRFLKLAEKAAPSAVLTPGFHFCQGLYHWYKNEQKEALTHFNHARKDGEWGRLAIMNMIEIYLNPDNDDLFSAATEAKGDNAENVAAAEKLLKELQLMGEKSPKLLVLEAYSMIATKNKIKIEKAISNLSSLGGPDKDYVPGLLAMANAFVLLQQVPKARNLLKRVQRLPIIPEFASELERCWLLLADMYIQTGKYEMATELCKKCISHNRSCAKAYEMLGGIHEKEQAYKDAADNYELAWQYTNQANPSTGYKLAFNYLKAKRFVEAVDVCNKVLKDYKDYPKIRKDILEKARASLRP